MLRPSERMQAGPDLSKREKGGHLRTGLFRNCLKCWDSTENWFLVLGLFSMAIITLINVVLRYLFGIAVSWSEEVVRYLMIWVTFIGMDVGVRDSKHLGVDFFVRLCGDRGEMVFRAISDVIGLGFAAAMAYLGVRLTITLFQTQQLSPALQVPMGIFYLVVPIGGVLSAIRYTLVLNEHLKKARRSVTYSGPERRELP